MEAQKPDMLDVALRLAASAASLSGALTLQMWQQGLLPDDVRAEFEQKLREMARDFEVGGADQGASQLWTAANLLRKPSPKGRGR